jgi:hypothetical protein
VVARQIEIVAPHWKAQRAGDRNLATKQTTRKRRNPKMFSGVRRQALHQQDVRLGKPFKSYLHRRVLHPGDSAQ